MTDATELQDIDTEPFLIACEQNTPEWYQARAGLTTASTFSVAVEVLEKDSPKKDKDGNPIRRKGDPTAANEKLVGNTAFELICEEPFPPPEYVSSGGGAARRGHDEEWKARAAYAEKFDVDVLESGVMVTHDRQFGYSTDGAVEGQKGGIEIKTPIDSTKIDEILLNATYSEYEHQVQGGMWICGWEWIDLVIWMPQLRKVGNELYVKRIWRDDNFIDAMVIELLKHRERVKEKVKFYSIPHSERPGMRDDTSVVTDVIPREIVKPAEPKIVVPKLAAPKGLENLF